MAPLQDKHFLPEIWALFGVGSLWTVMRFAVRIRTAGIMGLRTDDMFSFIALFCFAVCIAGINCTYYSGSNIDYQPDEVWTLSEARVKDAEWGNKFYVITAYAYITMVFSLKAVVIILYRRLAFGSWQKNLLRFTTVLCICGWIANTLMFSLMCLPFSRRFTVRPLPENKCTASSNFFIVLSCFNALGDALLLAIPVPLLWTLTIPLYKRVVVFALLASGIFVMAACIIRVSLTVVPNVTLRIIARWGARELAIATVAVNTASLRPMFRKSFWQPRKSALPQNHPNHPERKPGGYLFASALRAGQALGRGHYREDNLDTTSASLSTHDRSPPSHSSTANSSPDCATTPPQATHQSQSSRHSRVFSTLRSFGSNLSSATRSVARSNLAPTFTLQSADLDTERWTADMEKGKQVSEMVRKDTADSVVRKSETDM